MKKRQLDPGLYILLNTVLSDKVISFPFGVGVLAFPELIPHILRPVTVGVDVIVKVGGNVIFAEYPFFPTGDTLLKLTVVVLIVFTGAFITT